MASTRGRLLVLGGNPLHGSDALDSRDSNLKIDSLDSNLKIVTGVFDDGSPLERVLHILAERHAIHDEGLELVNGVLPSRLLSGMLLHGLTLEVDRF
jgi:hypothetical protein